MAEREKRTNAESALRRAVDERLSQVLALEAKVTQSERDAEQVTQEIKRLETQIQQTAQKEPLAPAAATRATIMTTPKTWHVRLASTTQPERSWGVRDASGYANIAQKARDWLVALGRT